MEINWDEMDKEPETGFEQQVQELRDHAGDSPGFLFPEDFEEEDEV